MLLEHYSYFYILSVAITAMIADIIIGDPQWLYNKIPHPVAIIGKVLSGAEKKFNNGSIINGGLSLLFIVAIFTCLSASVFLLDGWVRFISEVILASVLLAQNSLYRHVKAVAESLKLGDLQMAQEALQKLVSRDASRLDKHGVGRSAVESLAENFSDGVVAPLFWLAAGGLPAMVFYKAINTADSMWGYKNTRYEKFGKCTAFVDDAVNYLPARLSVIIIALASLFMPSARTGKLFSAVLSDAHQHHSPNAGYPEAAFAGALNLSLGGERHYAGIGTIQNWIGSGEKNLQASHVFLALTLYKWGGVVLLSTVGGGLILTL